MAENTLIDTTTQEFITGLISVIWNAEEAESVTNEMVARVLDFLNGMPPMLLEKIAEEAEARAKADEHIIKSIVHPVTVTDTSAADLIIADEDLNPIATFADGHIRTANFDSADIRNIDMPVDVRDTPAADLILADEDLNPIATFSGGHIRTANFNSANIPASSSASGPSDRLTLPGKWCALGTSITAWDITRVNGVKGYQHWVRQRVSFLGGYVNKGVNGYKMESLAANPALVVEADYYTLEFGTNEYLSSVPAGSLADYTGNTGNGTFAGAMRSVIDRIYQVNPSALIILCTPRKCYYPDYSLPSWTAPNPVGATTADYAEVVRKVAMYESLPVADFFALSNTNSHNLPALSNEVALHPNTAGHQLLANILVEQFRLLYQY